MDYQYQMQANKMPEAFQYGGLVMEAPKMGSLAEALVDVNEAAAFANAMAEQIEKVAARVVGYQPVGPLKEPTAQPSIPGYASEIKQASRYNREGLRRIEAAIVALQGAL